MKTGFFVVLSALIVFAASPVRSEEDWSPVDLRPKSGVPIIEDQTVIMGTDVAILIMGEAQSKARHAIRAGFEEIRRIEDLMTDWRSSPFERINQHAGEKPVVVDQEIFFLITESIRVSRLTDGNFDITYAGVGRLWDFRKRPPALPAAGEVSAALSTVGYSRIRVDTVNRSVYLPLRGMRIGLGGIAKGYAVDRAVARIKAMGVQNFAVNAGGDLTVRGRRDGNLWWVGIRHPRKKSENLAVLPISNGSVVTSGDSERFFVLDGVRYSHILNPKTGYPASGCQSVTLIARKAYLADAMATAVFVMGPEKGMEFVESQPRLEGMIVDADGKVAVSSGLEKNDDGSARTL